MELNLDSVAVHWFWITEVMVRVRLKAPRKAPERSQKLQQWPNQQSGTLVEIRNALPSSASPKDVKDHRRQLKWMIVESSLWWRKTFHNLNPYQEQTWKAMCIIAKVYSQELTKRCNPLITLKNKTARLELARKKNVRLRIVLEKKNGYNLDKINTYQNEGTGNKCRRREKAHDLKHTHLSKMVEEKCRSMGMYGRARTSRHVCQV